MYFSELFIKRIYRIGFLLVIILFLLDLLAFFYYPKTVFGDIFLATREQTPLTWISSLAMLFIALSSFSVYLKRKEKMWYLLAIIFFFFSMDDATYFHERISGFFVDNTSVLGFFPSYVWTIIYLPMLAFSLGTFFWLTWKDALKNNRKAIISALIVLGFATFLDFLDGFVGKNPGLTFCYEQYCNKVVLHIMRLTEEVSEVVALGILGYTNIKEHCIVSEDAIP
ncbi:MAG: hypothetical protein ACOYS2_03510 [Patescibacteria group bacterium]